MNNPSFSDFLEIRLKQKELNELINKAGIPSHQTSRTNVFIAYSTSDYELVERLIVHLKKIKLEPDAWDSSIIKNAPWENEVGRALQSAKAAILFVSNQFIASDFFKQKKLPILLENAVKDGLKVWLILVSEASLGETGLLGFNRAKSSSGMSIPFENIEQKKGKEEFYYEKETVFAKLAIALKESNQPLFSKRRILITIAGIASLVLAFLVGIFGNQSVNINFWQNNVILLLLSIFLFAFIFFVTTLFLDKQNG